MNERSKLISRLVSDIDSRTAYIRAKIGTLVPAQIRALRLRSDMPRQSDLAREADMQQSRISMFETPGAANVTLETLSRLAAAFRVGLVVKFVPFSDMLQWENKFSQDQFDVVRIEDDIQFINPVVEEQPRPLRARTVIGRNVSMHSVSMVAGLSAMSPLEVATITEHVAPAVNGTATVEISSPFGLALAGISQKPEAV